ncbi:cysteine proteinase, partial [Lichtheimia hyalospora FSU 10163]
MAATTAKKHQDKQAAKILNGGSAHQRNTLDSLLNRAIKFRKSRYVDEKLELFKKKYAPVNDRTTIQSSNSVNHANDVLAGIDANGFEQPSKVLFSKEKLNAAWATIRPIGAGLSSDLGPTSALNTVLQVVTYTPILCNYLLSRWHGNNCTMHDYCFVCALEDHVSLVLKNTKDTITPRQFIGKLKKMPKGTSTDAFQVWNYFMDQMQHALLLEKSTQDERIKQTTALYQMFGGFMQNHFVCDSCQKDGNNYDAFLNISLNIDTANTVEKCLSQNIRQQNLKGYKCPSCEKECSGKRTQSIYRAPPVLAIHLDRFGKNGKNDKMIKFQETLDIKRYVTETERETLEQSQYQLYGVITHRGASQQGGQYAAFAKSSNGLWHCFDNELVQQVSINRLLEQKAYMLFYTIPRSTQKSDKSKQSTTSSKGLKSVKVNLEEKKPAVKVQQDDDVESDESDVDQQQEESEDEDDKEEKAKVQQALDEAAAQPIADSKDAVVIRHNETMESKRDKLDQLIKREMDQSSSSQAKELLLSKSTNAQFQGDVETWDEKDAANEKKRLALIKKTKTKRKRPDQYDLDYDRGKVKKVKKKNNDKFNKPNVFQMAADSMQHNK